MPSGINLLWPCRSTHFNRVATLSTRSPVTAMALASDGSFLGIGSRDGLAVYDDKRRLVFTPEYHRMCGDVTQIHWMIDSDDNARVAFGTVFGYFIIWILDTGNKFRQSGWIRLPTSSEVMAIDSSKTSASVTRFAVGLLDNGLIIIDYEDARPLIVADKLSLKNTIPRSIFFNSDGSRILIAGMDDGQLLDLEVAERTIETNLSLSPNMLSVSWVATSTDTFAVVDNAVDGFSLFRCSVGEIVHTFETPRSGEAGPYGVSFFHRGNFFVAGSDHGKLYVFDVAQRSVHDVLYHARTGHMKHVTACSTGDASQIIAGALNTTTSSLFGGRAKAIGRVSIWQAKPPMGNNARGRPRRTLSEYIILAIQICGGLYCLHGAWLQLSKINYEKDIKIPFMHFRNRSVETSIVSQASVTPSASVVAHEAQSSSSTSSALSTPITIVAIASPSRTEATITTTVYVRISVPLHTRVIQLDGGHVLDRSQTSTVAVVKTLKADPIEFVGVQTVEADNEEQGTVADE